MKPIELLILRILSNRLIVVYDYTLLQLLFPRQNKVNKKMIIVPSLRAGSDYDLWEPWANTNMPRPSDGANSHAGIFNIFTRYIF